MLLAQDGRRAGTVSGGCLEAEVAKRAWWLSQDGPVVERYSTLEDDGDLPYGSGCGGVVYILLERRKTASPLLHALKSAFDVRKPLAIAAVLEGPHMAQRAFATLRPPVGSSTSDPIRDILLQELAEEALERRSSIEQKISDRWKGDSCLGGLSCRAPGPLDLRRRRRCQAAGSPGSRTRLVRRRGRRAFAPCDANPVPRSR